MTALLALDLSGDIGWATFDVTRPENDRVRFGTLPWRGQGYAAIAGKFTDWLHDFYSINPWQAMAWEEPWLNPKNDKVDKLKILIGLPIIACGFANSERHKMPFTAVTPQDVKKRMTDRRDADKADVIKACWSVGWKVGTEHEADACGVALCAYRRIWPKPAVPA